MKKLVSLLLVLCLTLGFTACTGKKGSDYVGSWVAVKYEVWGEEWSIEDGGEGWLILNEDGTGSMSHMGDLQDVKWKASGKSFKLTDGNDLNYTIKYDGETLSVDFMGMVMYLVRGEIGASQVGGDTVEACSLEGDWYGWWIIAEATDGYSESLNDWWDICATISFDDSGYGTIDLWDEDYTRSDLLGSVELERISETSASSGSGIFCNAEIVPGEWQLDMDESDLPNCVSFSGAYKDEYGSFEYYVYLRAWGQLWDDEDENNLPYYYNDWYLPLIEAGSAMPDYIGGEVTGDVS